MSELLCELFLFNLRCARYSSRIGATCQIRTDDLRFTKPMLYQLS
jgi:hypothetical protein